MNEQEAKQLADFLEDIWKSNVTLAGKCFWTQKVEAWLLGGGWKLDVKAFQCGVEAV